MSHPIVIYILKVLIFFFPQGKYLEAIQDCEQGSVGSEKILYTDVIRPDITLVRAKHLLYMPFAIDAFNIITKNKCSCKLATGRINRS